MDKNNVAEVLRSLAQKDSGRSETARLRDVFDEVEAALQAGVSRAAILDALQTQGFTMSLKGFESALYRIRKARSVGAPKQPQQAAITAQTVPVRDTAPTSPTTESVPIEAAAGKTRTETVLNTESPEFSFKQMQKAKDKK